MSFALPNAPFRPIILAPTYNNAGTLPGILERLDRLNQPIIIVNDGSTDDTAEHLRRWKQRPRAQRIFLQTHPRNAGKAAALRTGFTAAAQAGFTHAATIDTDGQLDPEQIPDILALAQQNPTALILGTRDDTKADYPARSRLGRRISNFAIRMESALRISDSQCGLRVYPLGLIAAVRCRAPFFAFEAEIITRAGWARCPVLEFPANCRYFVPPARVSHFRPVIDTLRGLRLHARLLLRATLPYPHPRWPAVNPSTPSTAPILNDQLTP
jgi:glycosyltransferase involved in cell wall biosynthesis